MNTNKKILIVRLDKIGDLICTLPIDQVFTQDQVQWVISPGLLPITQTAYPKRNAVELGSKFSFLNLKSLIMIILQFKPDAILTIQSPWWVGLVAFILNVSYRITVKSQWPSFLFYNFPLRQKRSQSKQHEYEYNLDLALHAHMQLKKNSDSEKKALLISETKELRSSLKKLHLQLKLDENFDLSILNSKLKNSYIVVHPGMAGSALNWQQEQYIDYILKFIVQNPNHFVVVTGTAADEIYLNKIKKQLSCNSQLIWLDEKLSLIELMYVLKNADCVIAPSTGILHLAASLNVPSHGIYSPIQVHHPVRWAARGLKVRTYLPQVNCPAKHHCLNEKCQYFNCMNQIQLPLKIQELTDYFILNHKS